eukprot:COSAG02_NODE_2159_length_9628_cov_7.080596_5_plen_66_part_00
MCAACTNVGESDGESDGEMANRSPSRFEVALGAAGFSLTPLDPDAPELSEIKMTLISVEFPKITK